MKIKALLLVVAAFALSACVNSLTPVGSKMAQLKPDIWNAKWQGADGETVRTKIKDARLGLVDMTTNHPWPKPNEPTKHLLVRMLGPWTVVNEKPDGYYQFGRIDIDANHLIVFDPDEPAFEKLVRHHEIAGKLGRDQNGKPNGSCIISGFSEQDYQRLKKEGFSIRTLFSEDPSTVLIRRRCPLCWW